MLNELRQVLLPQNLTLIERSTFKKSSKWRLPFNKSKHQRNDDIVVSAFRGKSKMHKRRRMMTEKNQTMLYVGEGPGSRTFQI
jgi:hypothetical protein